MRSRIGKIWPVAVIALLFGLTLMWAGLLFWVPLRFFFHII
jgi:hypothetical protein